jgi:outer membrane protein OmpA-like peptidoglycan-associated protein
MVCRSFLPHRPGLPRRGLPTAALVAASLLGGVAGDWSVAAADPLRMSLTAKVAAPAKPALTIIANEPLQNLSIALEPEAPADGGKPSGESGMLKLVQKQMKPGQKAVFALGSGKPGATHWQGMIQCQAGGKLWKREATFDTAVARSLEIAFERNYRSEHLDLVRRFVEVKLSAPAARATIEVYADDGTKMGSGAATFSSDPPGTWLRVPWQGGQAATAARDSVVLRLALTLHDTEGNEAKIDLYPWAVSVPHEEVNFATASAEVVAGEAGKLDESLHKINVVLDRVERTLMQFADKGITATDPPSPKLFVIGHTDTVGSDTGNLTLSRNRARAIATYFRSKGFRLPVFFIGYGERQLRARTADNVDDARNRRADYTLALEAPPTLAGTSWQKL